MPVARLRNPHRGRRERNRDCVKFVASPRHVDMLLVTGLVSRHRAEVLRPTCDARPEPQVAVDDAATGGADHRLCHCNRANPIEPTGRRHRPPRMAVEAIASEIRNLRSVGSCWFGVATDPKLPPSQPTRHPS